MSTALTRPSLTDLIPVVLADTRSKNTLLAYTRALRDFLSWCEANGRVLSRSTVQDYRNHLTGMGMAPASVNQALSAIKRLATESFYRDILSQSEWYAIKQVNGIKQRGQRMGNWLTRKQAQELLDKPDRTRAIGRRDSALLSLLLGCGLRREEAATLTVDQIQRREGRPVIVDIDSKHGRIRSIPMPSFTHERVSEWMGREKEGTVLAAFGVDGNMSGPLSSQGLGYVCSQYGVAPHDLRRTAARIWYVKTKDLVQVQELLGHASTDTTRRYIGDIIDLENSPVDKMDLV